ncbi:hypothetical protein IJH26_01530 [Candidatus Saccharibacteria bacterium]|nr:hypothetical protein [Candidatus Saccharibacteria bacterium]MBQ3476174.1 hypothetical protein [Candidatus Saccharibacteria bacterium]
MTSISEISSVAYKKGNWMRYTLWGVAVVCIGVLIYSFITAMSGNVSASVPEGYRFSVTDNYVEGSKNRTTYYIYDDRILVEDESFNDDSVNRVVTAYDGINTASLKNDNDTMELCELGSCAEKLKILVTIKKLISRRVGREYIGL